MAAQFTTTAFLLAAAREAYAAARRGNGDRAQSVRDLLAAQTADERDQVVLEWGAALLRRSLRVTALSFAKDEEIANVFWALRDSIDEEDGVFLDFNNEGEVLDRDPNGDVFQVAA